MFEWTPGISIMYGMTESEDEDLSEENLEAEIIEDAIKEFTEE